MESLRKLIDIVEQGRLPAPMEPTYKKDSQGNLVPDIDFKLNPQLKNQPSSPSLPRLDAPMEPTYKKDSQGNLVPDIDYKLNPHLKPQENPGPSVPPATRPQPTTPRNIPKMPTVPRPGQGIKKVTEGEFNQAVADIIKEINQQGVAEGSERPEPLSIRIYDKIEELKEKLKNTNDPDEGAFYRKKIKDLEHKLHSTHGDVRGVAEGSEETEETRVINTFEKFVMQGRDPLDMIAHKFGWGSYELDQLAKNLGFKNSAEWARGVRQGKGVNQGVAEGSETQKTFKVVYYSPKTDRNVTKIVKANNESDIWDKFQLKGINIISVSKQDVAEGRASDLTQLLISLAQERDLHDAIYDLLDDDSPLGAYIQNMYDSIARHSRLAHDDDYETIIDRIADVIVADYGNSN